MLETSSNARQKRSMLIFDVDHVFVFGDGERWIFGGERGAEGWRREVQWQFLMMGSEMRSKIARQRELLLTMLTLKWFLSRMNEKMILQIGLFRKASRTDRTPKRPSAIVNMRMTTKITGCGKTLRTLNTFVRFLLKDKQNPCLNSIHRQMTIDSLTLLCVNLW